MYVTCTSHDAGGFKKCKTNIFLHKKEKFINIFPKKEIYNTFGQTYYKIIYAVNYDVNKKMVMKGAAVLLISISEYYRFTKL